MTKVIMTVLKPIALTITSDIHQINFNTRILLVIKPFPIFIKYIHIILFGM